MAHALKKKYESSRQLARQASILAATRDMLAEVGYTGTTMRNLAQRAGVVPGTLYNLYGSKDELILAALEDMLDEVAGRAFAESEAGIDRIIALRERAGDAIVDNPAYAEAMGRALFHSAADHPLKVLLYDRTVDFIVEQLRSGQQNGEIDKAAKIELYARHSAAQAWGVIMAWVMGVFTLDEVRREYLRAQVYVLLPIVCDSYRDALLRRAGLTG